jgi:transcriptional antiterminator RfaH
VVQLLQNQETLIRTEPERLFKPGERVHITEVPFAGIEGIYQMANGERRAMVLIELLSKQMRVKIAPAILRKVV